jgi:hypothetical protein
VSGLAVAPSARTPSADPEARNGPVIVLACAHSGGARIVEGLAADPSVVATAGTGIIPLCGNAAQVWQQLQGRTGPQLSRLAISTLRALITTQVTMILAEAGKARWCELAIGATSAAQSFLQAFPDTAFVAVHRRSTDMIRAAVQASPWGLHMPRLAPYLSAYQGQTAAALAAHWADSTELLLAFEAANPRVTYRVRYEDAAADSSHALANLRSCLGLSCAVPHEAQLPEPASAGQPASEQMPPPETALPAYAIPRPLLDRLTQLHAELGYPPPELEA